MPVTIRQALDSATAALTASDSSRLDSEILLAHVLEVDRSYLFSYPEQPVSEQALQRFQNFIDRRAQSEPVAYIVGSKSFWDFDLKVNAAVLVPRPETELLVETALELGAPDKPLRIADLGTGSGAIALALAKARPGWQLLAVDISPEALQLAQENATALGLNNVEFKQGSWCEDLAAASFDMIVSNPPYVAPGDPHLTQGDLSHEPLLALQAEANGFAAFQTIAETARERLRPGGWLLLEHGFEQQQQLKSLLEKLGYVGVNGRADLAGCDRVVAGQWPGE